MLIAHSTTIYYLSKYLSTCTYFKFKMSFENTTLEDIKKCFDLFFLLKFNFAWLIKQGRIKELFKEGDQMPIKGGGGGCYSLQRYNLDHHFFLTKQRVWMNSSLKYYCQGALQHLRKKSHSFPDLFHVYDNDMNGDI